MNVLKLFRKEKKANEVVTLRKERLAVDPTTAKDKRRAHYSNGWLRRVPEYSGGYGENLLNRHDYDRVK